ncbi:MAG: hypothetical protein D6771_05620 [Zetaproteobacteria bacterium]|nr:MAG: hypothetical protein D6771_05620 [Zetaproteobacteria bacterium]
MCSDALAEGVNLQQASAVVMLDMPSVIRVAEQRIGRVDRLNSPHPKIEVWWPEDTKAFALEADRKFIQRHREVAAILGANIEIPHDENMRDWMDEHAFSAEEIMVRLRQAEQAPLDGIRDAFAPVRELVEGPQAVVRKEIYDAVAGSDAKVLSVIAAVRAKQPWAFFALSGRGGKAPQWVWFTDAHAPPETDLDRIAAHLRAMAQGHAPVDIHAAQDSVETLLRTFRRRLENAERSLLPRRKQRALEELEYLLSRYVLLPNLSLDEHEGLRWILHGVRGASEGLRLDLDAAAEAWLELVRDVWLDELGRRGQRKRPLRLRHLRRRLLAQPIPASRIVRRFEKVPRTEGISYRAAVTILGVPG